MLVAYFDGSGTDAESKYVVVAGFVAPSHRWVDFENEWASFLRTPRYSLEYAHARRLSSLGAAARDSFYLEANRLLKKHTSFAVAATFKKSDYRTIFGKSYRLTVKDAMYPFAFRMAIVNVCVQIEREFPGESVAVVIER